MPVLDSILGKLKLQKSQFQDKIESRKTNISETSSTNTNETTNSIVSETTNETISSNNTLTGNALLKSEIDLHMDLEGHIYTTLPLIKALKKYFKPMLLNSEPLYDMLEGAESSPIGDREGLYIYINHMHIISYLYQYYKLDRAFTLEQACALAAIAQCESKCKPTFPKADYIDLNNNIIDTSYDKGFKEFRPGEYDYAAGLLGFKTYERKKKLIEYIGGIVDNDHPPLIENYSLNDQLEMIMIELYEDEDYQYIVNLMNNNNNEHNIEEVTTILYDNYSNQTEPLEYAISVAKELLENYNMYYLYE